MSAHYEDFGDSSEDLFSWELEHPTKYLGYPRVYVSRDEHANYATSGECEDGGAADVDTCVGNSDSGRIFVGGYRNVGSSITNLINAVTSQRAGYTGTEYFWTAQDFCGWEEPDPNGSAGLF